ncbi:tetratricopeptide repeat protein [Sediminispirochaeta smaragdinae]|jgi:tetratricopeptide (TPR) repeat protein|uniref:TPR repeat-containing protein n=1 Tax=Sediminispirochaeta smaragdinae (strain DSM 11293 / JCM 15392 / SEBR 4228) TaxID=573413 RepID=E1R5E3_SEDSS|nr:tetratricopeptide repeat protein [Sediminispirochaeta smaragdinae]ADK82271.1 TPR repeat-containing protein [Sediminispirochaeta smaragdinae DSM 11293]
MNNLLETGLAFYRAKRYEKALDYFTSLDVDPAEYPDLAYYLGLCYTKLEKYDEALLYLEQVVTNHDDFLHIYQCRMVLGYIYNVTGRYRLAEFEMRELLDAGFESPQVYSTLGFALFSQGKTDISLDYYRKALDLEPGNSNALNSVGYTMVELDQELPEATDNIRKALEARPEHAAYLDSLGWALFKMGRIREARRILGRAYDLSKGNRVIASHLRKVIDEEGEEES